MNKLTIYIKKILAKDYILNNYLISVQNKKMIIVLTRKNYESDEVQLSFIIMNPYYINQMRRKYNKHTYYDKFRTPEKNVDYH